MLAGVEAAGECASTRMARAAKAVDNGLAARDCSGVAATWRFGTGALRARCLTIPASVSALADETATTSTAASPAPPHFRNLFFIRQVRIPVQTNNAIAATIAARPRMLSMFDQGCERVWIGGAGHEAMTLPMPPHVTRSPARGGHRGEAGEPFVPTDWQRDSLCLLVAEEARPGANPLANRTQPLDLIRLDARIGLAIGI